MSDDIGDYARASIAKDERFRRLQDAIAVGDEMANNATIRLLLDAIRADADLAMIEIADTSPTDAKAISLLSVRIGVYIYIKRVLNTIRRRGELAEVDIRSQEVARFQDE